MWADPGYHSYKTHALTQSYAVPLEMVKHPPSRFWVPKSVTDIRDYLTKLGYDISARFKVLPRRWVVERTLAWLNKYRRLSKDMRICQKTSENTLLIVMIRTLLRRMVTLDAV